VAEWLRRGLQILAPRFDSGRGLQQIQRLSRFFQSVENLLSVFCQSELAEFPAGVSVSKCPYPAAPVMLMETKSNPCGPLGYSVEPSSGSRVANHARILLDGSFRLPQSCEGSLDFIRGREAKMNDDELGKELVERLKIDGAYKQLVDRLSTSPPCPMCSDTRWFVESDSKGLVQKPSPGFLMKDPRGHIGPAPSVPALVFSCSNCGFIRMHNIAVLNKKGG